MTKFKEIQVRFIPTNVILTVPEPDLIKLLENDRGNNFEVLDKNFEVPKEPDIVEETSTYEKVVIDDDKKNVKKVKSKKTK